MNGRGMSLGAALFMIWAVLVMLFWVVSSPASAPQQAALAGQVLVLVCVPYCVLSVIQRSWAAAREVKEQEPPLELVKEVPKGA